MTALAVHLPTGRTLRVLGLAGPDAGDLVVLPRADYEALRAAAAGVDRPPPEALARIAAGASAVRVWRRHRGLTARALAARAGVDPGYLSQIETGHKPGSVKALRALARALGARLDDLALPPRGLD